MGWSLIDHFRTFHSLSKEYDLSAGARSVYFALLGEFNAAYWPDELRISDRQMQELSGVKSVATVHDARNLLKSLKLIDFRKGKNRKTIYRLLTDRIANTAQTPIAELSEHRPNTCQTLDERTGLFPIPACAREDVKTLDLKTSSSVSATRARETLSSVPPKAEMDIHEVWEYETGYRLTGSVAYELEELAKSDFEGVRQAIIAAVKSKDTARVRYNHFRAIYDGTKKPKRQPLKGGEKSGGQSTIYQYELPPADNGDEPWAGY